MVQLNAKKEMTNSVIRLHIDDRSDCDTAHI